MKLSVPVVLFLITFNISVLAADWPMSNDVRFDTSVENPVHETAKDPIILLDAAHHNFHVTEGFIDPFAELAASDGYQTIVGTSRFTPESLRSFNIVMVITALPFEFTSKTEITTEITFTEAEIESLYDWVYSGGSLLVFSEHAPFDQAINPLLNRFGVTSSIGTIADPVHYDKELEREGWIVFSRENGLLHAEHPIFGDSNGFTAMNFDQEDGSVKPLGMNTEHHDWKQMVLNSLRWLSFDL